MNTLPDEVKEKILAIINSFESEVIRHDDPEYVHRVILNEDYPNLADKIMEEYAKAYAPVPGKEEVEFAEWMNKERMKGMEGETSVWNDEDIWGSINPFTKCLDLFRNSSTKQSNEDKGYVITGGHFVKAEPKAVQQAAKEYEQDFKELNLYLDELCLGTSGNKDAGNLWIQFTDKFNAFKKKVLAGASFTEAKAVENK